MRSQRWAAHAFAGLAMLALVVGCSAGSTPAPAGSATPAPSPAVAAPSAALTGLDRVKAAGEVVWCSSTDYPPFESVGATASPEGLDVDIAAAIAEQWGVRSRIAPMGWDGLLSALNAGSCDLVISGMTSTFGDRAQQADFVDYLETWLAFVVPAGNPRGIHTLDDLAGKSVVVEPGFASEDSLRAASDALVAAGKPAIRIITETRSDEAWVEELTHGRVDALAGDSTAVVFHVGEPPYAGKAEIGGPAIDPEPLGIGVRKDDDGMKDAVAAAVAAMTADGTLKTIVDRWGMTDAVALLHGN
jgi:polar amino acid transport system substrate-binding protein